MAAPKGHKGFKPVGSKHLKTIEWEQFGRELLEKGMPRALDIMETCEDDKFMNHFTGLLEYFKPKLARVDNLDLPKNSKPLTKIEIVDTNQSEISTNNI
jgi:hypothetical protein